MIRILGMYDALLVRNARIVLCQCQAKCPKPKLTCSITLPTSNLSERPGKTAGSQTPGHLGFWSSTKQNEEYRRSMLREFNCDPKTGNRKN